jgi:cell division protein FtsI/penicillin-binding protein 2
MITKETAIVIARKRAKEKEWSLEEPLEVVERRGWLSRKPTLFKITTNVGRAGNKAHFTIDAKTGAILNESYAAKMKEAVINQDAAIAIARQYAEDEGWTVDDPESAERMGWGPIDPVIVDTDIKNGELVFIVKTNVIWIDGSTHIAIHSKTGEILSVHTPSP